MVYSNGALEALYFGVQGYSKLAFLALSIYDLFLTFEDEVRYFWCRCRKIARGACLLFLLVRLNQLWLIAIVVIQLVPVTSTCRGWSLFLAVSNYWAVPMMIISSMRVYAITGRSWVLTLLTMSLGLLPVILHMESSKGIFIIFIGRSATIACDVVVVAAIWWNMSHVVASRLRYSLDGCYAISWYLWRDGTFYFIAMSVLNVVDIVITQVIDIPLDIYVKSITCPLSTLLLARFLLNLREAADSSDPATESSGFLDKHLPWVKSQTLVFSNGAADEDSESCESSFIGDVAEDGGDHSVLYIGHGHEQLGEQCSV